MAGAGDSPRVSVLMPVHDGARYLESAVRSVLAQSFGDFELVAVDDGSGDGTPEILAELSQEDARIRVFRQANTGIVGALNAGIARCRGEYLARMDCDDLCLPHRFAEQVAHLDANPDCVLVGGLAETIDAEGAPIAIVSGGPHRQTRLDIFPPKVAVSLHPLIMLRRRALDILGGYRADFPHAEDYDLYIRLSTQGGIDNPDRVMLRYRKHEGAISQRNLETQERSAALAEVSALLNLRINGDVLDGAGVALERDMPRFIPPGLFEAYVSYRIWRRMNDTYPDRAGAARDRVAAALFSLRRADLFSRDYARLRVRMAAGLARSIYQNARKGRAPAAASVSGSK